MDNCLPVVLYGVKLVALHAEELAHKNVSGHSVHERIYIFALRSRSSKYKVTQFGL